MNATGQYRDTNSRDQVVFREGDILSFMSSSLITGVRVSLTVSSNNRSRNVRSQFSWRLGAADRQK